MQEVKDFYLREMARAGWELEGSVGDSGGKDDSIRLNYRQGEETSAIFISPEGGGLVHVTIMS